MRAPKKSKEAVLKDWSKKSNLKTERVNYTADTLVNSEFGIPGAIAITNKHQKEFFLETITIEGFACGPVHFPCNSRVQSTKDHSKIPLYEQLNKVKLLDFAELERSSISFFDLDKQQTAISRWSRARPRAAKVGKGLSKNGKAQKLALQHWLEAIDPRHHYGHNLHFYYGKWLHSQSKEPFFYWLDIGEGKEVNLVDKCPRSKLQQQCIKYLGLMERKE